MEKPCEAKGSSWKISACLHPPGAVQLQPSEYSGPSPAATGLGWFQQLLQKGGSAPWESRARTGPAGPVEHQRGKSC